MVFLVCPDEVGSYPSLVRIYIYLAYLSLELIFGCRSIYCGLPLAIEIFLVT
jgi:hypothetical protein